MDKIAKSMTLFTYIWCGLFFVIFLFQEPMADIEFYFRETERIVVSIFIFVGGIFAFIVMGQMVKSHNKIPTLITEILFCFFLLSGTAGLIQATFGMIDINSESLHNFCSDSAYIFIAGSSFMLGYFVIEVFFKGLREKRNRFMLYIFGLTVVFADLAVYLHILIDLDDFFLYSAVLFLFLMTIGLYVVLIIKSMRYRKSPGSPARKRSFTFLGSSGVFLICAFMLTVAYLLTKQISLRILNSIFFLIGYALLYRGFTVPGKYQ